MRFRKFLNPYKTRDSSFREYTIMIGVNYTPLYNFLKKITHKALSHV